MFSTQNVGVFFWVGVGDAPRPSSPVKEPAQKSPSPKPHSCRCCTAPEDRDDYVPPQQSKGASLAGSWETLPKPQASKGKL